MKEWRFWRKPSGIYYVMYRHTPGKWRSTGSRDIAEAAVWAKENQFISSNLRLHAVPTLAAFAADFFTTKDPHGWLKRRKAKGRDLSAAELKAAQARLTNYILPAFGSTLISAISTRAIDDWLISLKDTQATNRQGGWTTVGNNLRNKILFNFRQLLQEAKEQGLVSSNVAAEVTPYVDRPEPRKVFSQDELVQLFPSDLNQALDIWLSLFWACFFRIMALAGLRPSEVAALHWSDFYEDFSGFHVHRSVNSQRLLKGLKTARSGVKERAAYIDSVTVEWLKLLRADNGSPQIFLLNGRYVVPETSNKHFKASVVRSGVSLHNRTQYCLRHSFDTDMLKIMSREQVGDLMGHKAYRPDYDHRSAADILQQHRSLQGSIEQRILGNKEE